MPSPMLRVRRYLQRTSARRVFQRPQAIRLDQPLISFTFDDFPRSALLNGGAILKRFGLNATYFTAMGLIGKDSPSGQIAGVDDLRKASEDGHELGCHTYSHCDSWQTPTSTFEESVKLNSATIGEVVPGLRFASFSYPISEPRPLTKRAVSKYFQCCRAGGQRLNKGTADLNQLAAYFLERSTNGLQEVRELIDQNKHECGWIIFATHDITDNPSQYGCTPAFFENVVRYSVDSGAEVLPVIQALKRIQSSERPAA
jgi:peptidoglycan/xylan/chitin deacetylase (PgdA/CDA1 family)